MAAKIVPFLVLVFCLVQLGSVLGQEGSFQDLIGQGEGFSSTLEEAKKALGAANEVASAQGALNDYFGDGADEGSDGGAASLAGLLDTSERYITYIHFFDCLQNFPFQS